MATNDKPFERRVREIIAQEFSAQGFKTKNLPEQFHEAIRNIVRRVAADREFTYQDRFKPPASISAQVAWERH